MSPPWSTRRPPAGGPVDLFGHSYGGNVAFGAAGLTSNIRRLVLYEGWPPPNVAHRTASPELLRDLESLLANGQREQVLEAFYRDLVRGVRGGDRRHQGGADVAGARGRGPYRCQGASRVRRPRLRPG